MNLLARREKNLPETTPLRHSAVNEIFHRLLRSWMEEDSRGREQELEIGEKEVRLSLPCPGRKPENIDVEIMGDLLTVKSCSCGTGAKETKNGRERSCVFSERCDSMCVAAFHIPVKVIGKEARACCRDGVLNVTLPRDLSKGMSQVVKIKCEQE